MDSTDSLLTRLRQTHGILRKAAFVFHSLMIRQGPSGSYFMPSSVRLFWNSFLKFSNGFGLFVSSLHEAGGLLLFFLAPSCFLLPLLKGFTCHKTSFSVMDAPDQLSLSSRRCIMRCRKVLVCSQKMAESSHHVRELS